MLNKDIAVREVKATMDALPEGQQAGPNRIPNMVYKTLSRLLAPIVCEVFNAIDNKKEVP